MIRGRQKSCCKGNLFQTVLVLVIFILAGSVSLPAQVNNWYEITRMPIPRSYPSISEVEGKIYAIGDDRNLPLTSHIAEVYDTETDTWDTCANMPTERLYPGTCVLDGKIYVIGGCTARPELGSLATVEEYDPVTDRWTSLKSLNTLKGIAPAVVVDHKIWVLGGDINGNGDTCYTGIEIYDPRNDQWSPFPDDMPVGRAEFTAISLNDRIYVLGGLTNYTNTHALVPEVLVYNIPLIFVKSNPVLSLSDSLVLMVHEDGRLFLHPYSSESQSSGTRP